MPFQLVRNDITRMAVDAIVNAANTSLLGGGGVDGAIHRAAGPKLLEECRTLGGCRTGDAKITKAYDLPCRYVIHTVGPRWKGGDRGEKDLLTSCYRTSLELALSHGCESVAFPLISSGAYGYPKDKAMKVAVDTIGDFLMEHDTDMMVYLVVFGKESVSLGHKLSSDIREYIDDNFTDLRERQDRYRRRRFYEDRDAGISGNMPFLYESTAAFPDEALGAPAEEEPEYPCSASDASPIHASPKPKASSFSPSLTVPVPSPSKPVFELDESFQQMLLRKIDELGITDAQCYKKANIDRKLFSKIRGDAAYRPSKPTAIAFAIALELSRKETDELLRKAGYALSKSNLFDVIISYFIEKHNYNIFDINETLFAYDQSLLGQ